MSQQYAGGATEGRSAPVDHARWSDSSARAVLQLMVESVAEMIGFEVAALSVVLHDQLVTVAYTGPEEYREYLEQPDPVGVLDPVIAQAESWGRFHYLAGGTYETDDLEGHWVAFDEELPELAEGWHPQDALIALLTDDEGRLVGAMSVDRPVTGLRPDAAQRRLLERYAAQVERAVITAFEREELVRQVSAAETARKLIRSASMPAQASLEAVLQHTHGPLVEGFRASGSWIQVLDPAGDGRGAVRAHGGEIVTLSDRMVDLAHHFAPRLWAEQRVFVITEDSESEVPDGAGALLAQGRQQLRELGLASALGVPLGVGAECLGFLVLSRRSEDPAWTPGEIGSALEIGHDLGAALMTARALERERNLVRELQQLDDYRTRLIATLSHELRTPLTVISGNLEMLGDLDLEDLATHYRDAMTRGTTRMAKVVDDLLLLARVSDPRHPLVRLPVDLRRVAEEAVALVESAARTQEVSVRVELGEERLLVQGDPAELDRLLTNLVSNAVKYNEPGGTVMVSLARRGDTVEVRVTDDGIGISEEDQFGLFSPFFRTTNPQALSQPGTGLGLSIVATIAERHHGRIDVSSRVGEGTTFTVTLPVA